MNHIKDLKILLTSNVFLLLVVLILTINTKDLQKEIKELKSSVCQVVTQEVKPNIFDQFDNDTDTVTQEVKPNIFDQFDNEISY